MRSTDEHIILNQQCRLQPGGKFGSLFSWVQYSNYAGQVTINGRLCDEYSLTSKNDTLYMDVVTGTNPAVPVRYSVYRNQKFLVSYTWGSDLVPNVTASELDLPKICTFNNGLGFVCTSKLKHARTHARTRSHAGGVRSIDSIVVGARAGPQGPVVNMTMYRFHSASDYSLTNHNTADLAGDTGYLCLTGYTSSKDSIISIFVVSVNSTWGRYALCNAGSCALERARLAAAARTTSYRARQMRSRRVRGHQSIDCWPGSHGSTDGLLWPMPKQSRCVAAAGGGRGAASLQRMVVLTDRPEWHSARKLVLARRSGRVSARSRGWIRQVRLAGTRAIRLQDWWGDYFLQRANTTTAAVLLLLLRRLSIESRASRSSA